MNSQYPSKLYYNKKINLKNKSRQELLFHIYVTLSPLNVDGRYHRRADNRVFAAKAERECSSGARHERGRNHVVVFTGSFCNNLCIYLVKTLTVVLFHCIALSQRAMSERPVRYPIPHVAVFLCHRNQLRPIAIRTATNNV